MKKLLLALALVLAPTIAQADYNECARFVESEIHRTQVALESCDSIDGCELAAVESASVLEIDLCDLIFEID